MRLGELQLRILKVLWRRSPATVSDVRDALDGEPLAYTTVATMLRKMESRQLVRHSSEGRKFYYEPLISESEVSRNLSDDLVDRLFGGSLTQAVSHLLQTREIDDAELAELERLIKHRKDAEGAA